MRILYLLLSAVLGCLLVPALLFLMFQQPSIVTARSAPSHLDLPGTQPDSAVAKFQDFLHVIPFQPTQGGVTKPESGGQITGRVTSLDSGVPLEHVLVTIYNSTTYSSVVDATFADAAGVYWFVNLMPDTYYVGFDPGPGYFREYYNDEPSLATADPVSVTEGNVTSGIDAALLSLGQITGRVTIAGSAHPLEHVWATIYTSTTSSSSVAWVITDAAGVYTVTGLMTGTYYVGFDPGSGYFGEYYNDKPSLTTADPVSVTVGNVTSGIDAALLSLGQITGRVTIAGSGLPLENVSVSVYTNAASSGWVAYGITDAVGVYTATGLMTGTYYVGFDPGSGYFGEYYNDKLSLTTADPVSVTVGNVTGDIDAALLPGGKITGHVTSVGNGHPLSGTRVDVYTSTTAPIGSALATAWTDTSGVYTVTPLLTGTYYVQFDWPPFLPEYYADKSSLSTADPVNVALGHVTGGIDAVLSVFTAYLPTVFHDYHPTVMEISTSSGLPKVIVLNLRNDQGWMHPMYSLDGGKTWQAVATVPWNDQPTDVHIVIAPRADHSLRILAAADHGLYRTGDFGQSWAFVDSWNQSQFVSDALVASPADPFRLYRTSNYEEWIISPLFPPEFFIYGNVSDSTDSGGSWSINLGGRDWEFDAIVPSPSVANLKYVHYFHVVNNVPTFGWLPTVNLNSSFFVIDSQNSTWLYTIGARSSDGGATWVPWANLPCDVWQLLPHPTKTHMLFVRCEQGLFRSVNAGDAWVQLSTTSGDLLAPDYGNPGRLIWARPNGLWVSCDDGNHWVSIGVGCFLPSR